MYARCRSLCLLFLHFTLSRLLLLPPTSLLLKERSESFPVFPRRFLFPLGASSRRKVYTCSVAKLLLCPSSAPPSQRVERTRAPSSLSRGHSTFPLFTLPRSFSRRAIARASLSPSARDLFPNSFPCLIGSSVAIYGASRGDRAISFGIRECARDLDVTA